MYQGATLADGFGVVTRGHSTLLAPGSIVASFSVALRLVRNSGGYIQVGQAGSIIAANDTAIAGSVTGILSVHNVGLTSGTVRAMDLGPHTSGPATGGLTLVNSGTTSSGALGSTMPCPLESRTSR